MDMFFVYFLTPLLFLSSRICLKNKLRAAVTVKKVQIINKKVKQVVTIKIMAAMTKTKTVKKNIKR